MPTTICKHGNVAPNRTQSFLMKKLTIDIEIPSERYEALYSGKVSNVKATSREGVVVQFPGRILHKFINHKGISGTFVIEFDDDNKFRGITKIV
jgi:hypothetical protein